MELHKFVMQFKEIENSERNTKNKKKLTSESLFPEN